MLRTLLGIVVLLFPVLEITLAIRKRADSQVANNEDRGSMLLFWFAIALGVGSAIAFQWVPAGRFTFPADAVRLVALCLLVGGLAIRWVAIVTLGRFFTVDVAIHHGHTVVDRGLYRHVRHPAYTGILMAFLGLGVFFANWLSLVALMLPVTLAGVNRVAKEERALTGALGRAYADYCARTWRFIPWLV